LDRVRDGLLSIREFPAAAPTIGGGYRRHILTEFPYGLVFRIEDGKVLIVAVAHHKRKPRYWKSRTGARKESD
jgi:plasmid stabilization system protein ParE